MNTPPTGPVTFLFTDIEGSTRLAQELAESYNEVLKIHDDILSEVIESKNGFIFKKVGDAFCASFSDPIDAVTAAAEIQRRLSERNNDNFTIKVRMGIHSGNAEFRNGDYTGISLNIVNRIMSAAHGGQILFSSNVYKSLKDYPSDVLSFRSFGERKLKDILQPLEIYQVVCDGLPNDFPPIRSVDARQNNLPSETTNFVGRTKELSEIKRIFYQSRLITLSGSGGTGKTRLAIKLASELIDEFENGVWIIELSQIQDHLLVAQEIANQFSLKDEPGRLTEDCLIEFLKGKEVLIVLDNCEHLIHECARLCEKILRNCQKIKFIITSREPLRCEGESIYRVPSLDHPDPKESYSVSTLTQYEAVRLFIERAVAVNNNFKVNNDNMAALAEICYRLDGIPLAIELAAVRVKILSLEKICEKLDDRFRLLTDSKRTSIPRQKTLRALIDWSYDLLSGNEKVLWRRLSAFNGSWRLEDAEGVCSDDAVEEAEILELIQSLTEKSIVSYRDDTNHYRMLETIKQYGTEKLSESGEEDVIRLRHLNYYLNFCESAIPELHGKKSRIRLDEIEEEYQNIQSALHWSIESNHKAEGTRLAVSLAKFWSLRGLLTEGRMWLSKLMQNANDIEESLMANAKRIAGILATQQGDHKQARDFILESIVEFKKTNDTKGLSVSLGTLGLIYFDLGDLKSAKECLEECISMKREVNDRIGLCSSLNAMGLVILAEGEFENAKKCFEETMKIAEEDNDAEYQAIAYNNIAQIYEHYGDWDRAVEYFKMGLEKDRELGNKGGIAVSISNLATIETTKKNFTAARELYEESLKMSRESNFREGILFALVGLGLLNLMERKYQEAKNVFIECLNEQIETPDLKCSSQSLIGLAQVYAVEGNTEMAGRLLGAVEEKLKASGIFFDTKLLEQKKSVIGEVLKKISRDDFENQFAAGKNISFEDAIQLALKA